MTFMETLAKAVATPIKSKAEFIVGQRVRVLKSVVEDGQTPAYWSGAVCEVFGVRVGGAICKRWVYRLRHKNGELCDFEDHELDQRFTRNK